MDGWHKETLGNFVHVSGVTYRSTAVSFAEVGSDFGEILFIELAFQVQACIYCSSWCHFAVFAFTANVGNELICAYVKSIVLS